MASLSYGNVMAVLDVASVRTLARQTAGTPYNVVAKTITTANTASVFTQNANIGFSSLSSNVFTSFTSVNASLFGTGVQTNTSNLAKVLTYYTGNIQPQANITNRGTIIFGNISGVEMFANIYQSTGHTLDLSYLKSNLAKVLTYYTGNVQPQANITARGTIILGNTAGIETFSNIYQSLGQSYTTTGVYLVGKGGLSSISTGGGGGGGGLTGKIESWT